MFKKIKSNVIDLKLPKENYFNWFNIKHYRYGQEMPQNITISHKEGYAIARRLVQQFK